MLQLSCYMDSPDEESCYIASLRNNLSEFFTVMYHKTYLLFKNFKDDLSSEPLSLPRPKFLLTKEVVIGFIEKVFRSFLKFLLISEAGKGGNLILFRLCICI